MPVVDSSDSSPPPAVPTEPNISFTETALYYHHLMMEAMKITNDIPGIEFESYNDYMAHVDKTLEKILKGTYWMLNDPQFEG